MKLKRSFFALLLCCALLLSCGGAAASADPSPFSVQLFIGEETVNVLAMQNDYAGNYYLSLSDLSAALSRTPAAFRFGYQYTAADGEFFTVTLGQNADCYTTAGNPTEEPWVSSFSPFRNRIFVNGQERRYYTYRAGRDLYMSLTDIQLMLDMPAELQEDGIRLYPGQRFYPDVLRLAEQGYFACFSAVLLGDADTGEILYAHNADDPVPIASITKLMSLLLLEEALKSGDISLYDQVTVSANAAALSRGPDAMVTLNEGQSYPFQDLLQVMLLASSNESALALAEHLAGSEAAFVDRMNERARELGLDSAHFFNPHGLPLYLQQAVTAKVQNVMSAEDLFLLCQILLRDYPEITQITGECFGSMPSLNYITANSNPLVFNLEGCNGLKTGTTNKAGACLVATLPVTVGGETHTAVAIVLGSECTDVRNQAAEILLRYARDSWTEQGFPQPEPEPTPAPTPSPETKPMPGKKGR